MRPNRGEQLPPERDPTNESFWPPPERSREVPGGYRWHKTIACMRFSLGPVNVTGMTYDEAVDAAWAHYNKRR